MSLSSTLLLHKTSQSFLCCPNAFSSSRTWLSGFPSLVAGLWDKDLSRKEAMHPSVSPHCNSVAMVRTLTVGNCPSERLRSFLWDPRSLQSTSFSKSKSDPWAELWLPVSRWALPFHTCCGSLVPYQGRNTQDRFIMNFQPPKHVKINLFLLSSHRTSGISLR